MSSAASYIACGLDPEKVFGPIGGRFLCREGSGLDIYMGGKDQECKYSSLLH